MENVRVAIIHRYVVNTNKDIGRLGDADMFGEKMESGIAIIASISISCYGLHLQMTIHVAGHEQFKPLLQDLIR